MPPDSPGLPRSPGEQRLDLIRQILPPEYRLSQYDTATYHFGDVSLCIIRLSGGRRIWCLAALFC